ncbi:MAG: phosphatidate cytidylyltransferase [Rickettsiales bacterium]|nr:phosphatidate cytidylyltransferase [Rickettsiales bacterium]
MEAAKKANRFSDLGKRAIFGIIAAIVALSATIYSPISFYGLMLFAALLMHLEWVELTKDIPSAAMRIGGLIYVGIPVWSLIYLRDLDLIHVLFIFSIVWATDIGAYFGGKQFGKRKLAPSVSPGKTIEGLLFGIGFAVAIGTLGLLYTPHDLIHLLFISTILAIVSQAGDLFESAIKRKAQVKDSGTFLPGHGGILDRVDGLAFAAPVYALFVLLSPATL